MYYVSILYCVNYDVFRETKFFNSKEDVDLWIHVNHNEYLLKCKSNLNDLLVANRSMSIFSYGHNNMFMLDYGKVPGPYKVLSDESDSDTETEIEKLSIEKLSIDL